MNQCVKAKTSSVPLSHVGYTSADLKKRDIYFYTATKFSRGRKERAVSS